MSKYLCVGCRQIHDDGDMNMLDGDIPLQTTKQEEFMKTILKEKADELPVSDSDKEKKLIDKVFYWQNQCISLTEEIKSKVLQIETLQFDSKNNKDLIDRDEVLKLL